MKNQSPIFIVPDDIKSTETFKKLTFIQQKIHLNRNSRIEIQSSINVVLMMGLEEWLSRSNASTYHKDIVKELFELKTKKTC